MYQIVIYLDKHSAFSRIHYFTLRSSQRVRALVNLSERRLPYDVSTLRCFYECLAQAMTADQCQDYIENLLGGPTLPNHEIPNLQIKINRPRPTNWVSETYWMIGIPTNIYGEVDCDLNSGIIKYPWTWTVANVDYTIPEVSCVGLPADECCTKVLDQIELEGIPLVDDNGNCLSCWSHQEPLEPIIPPSGSDVVYLEHSASSGTCTESELSVTEVNSADTDAEAALQVVRNDIDAVIAAGTVSCSVFTALFNNLLLSARAFPRAMSRIPSLLCGICENPTDTYELTEEIITRLLWIKQEITGEINSAENCIVIYVDHQDLVLEPPKIGGSREGLDFDRDDPDCVDGPDGNNPVMSPVQVPTPDGNNPVMAPVDVPTGGDNPVMAPVDMPTPDGMDCSGGKLMVNSECVCPSGSEDVNGNCEQNCSGGQIRDSSGVCECPTGQLAGADGKCFTCIPPLTLNSSKDGCVCEPDYATLPSGECKKCVGESIPSIDGTECVCPTGTVLLNGDCFGCTAPAVLNAAQDACVCQAGFGTTESGGCEKCTGGAIVLNDGKCGCPTGQFMGPNSCFSCNSPLIGNSKTGQCDCPSGMSMSGGKCVCTGAGLVMNQSGDGCVAPADSCPPGTSYFPASGVCQTCNCGFCPEKNKRTDGWEECCEMNAHGNNCKPPGGNSSLKGCNFAKTDLFYPGYSDQSGNVCSGVEVKLGAQIPVGCGCKPNAAAPCTYDPSNPNRCFVCSVEDLADLSAGTNSYCSGCRACLKAKCTSWTAGCQAILAGGPATVSQWESCLAESGSQRFRGLRSDSRILGPPAKATTGTGSTSTTVTQGGAAKKATDCALQCASACKFNAEYSTM